MHLTEQQVWSLKERQAQPSVPGNCTDGMLIKSSEEARTSSQFPTAAESEQVHKTHWNEWEVTVARRPLEFAFFAAFF